MLSIFDGVVMLTRDQDGTASQSSAALSVSVNERLGLSQSVDPVSQGLTNSRSVSPRIHFRPKLLISLLILTRYF